MIKSDYRVTTKTKKEKPEPPKATKVPPGVVLDGFSIDKAIVGLEKRYGNTIATTEDAPVEWWVTERSRDIGTYVRECYDSRRFYFENELKIVTKSAERRALVVKRAQQRIMKIITEQRKAKKPVRILVDKVRRLGSSTVCLADLYAETTMRTNFKSVVIAHRADSTDNLFSMLKCFYDFQHPEMRPMRKKSNAKELVFKNPDEKTFDDNPGLNSHVKVFTAGSEGAALGETIHYFLGSEVAMWDECKADAVSINGAVEIAVPHLPGTTVIYESSGYGKGGWFHDEFHKALNGENGYTPIFVGYFDDEDCSVEATAKERTAWHELLEAESKSDVKAVESILDWFKWHNRGMGRFTWLFDYKKKHPAEVPMTVEHAKYLTQTFKNECHGDLKTLKNMYPADVNDSFMYGQSNLFDNFLLDRQLKKFACPGKLYMMDVDPATGVKAFKEADNGWVEVWDVPKPGTFYVCGIDPSEGVGNDSYCVNVFRLTPFEQVAKFKRNDMPLSDTKEISFNLAKWYNWAFTIIESNAAGNDVVNFFINQNYPNLYKRRQFDDVNKVETFVAGWKTQKSEKWMLQTTLVEKLNREIHDTPIMKLHSEETIKELMTIQRESNGLASAPRGMHDDDFMSCGMAAVASRAKEQLALYVERQKEKEGKKVDDTAYKKNPSMYDNPNRLQIEMKKNKEGEGGDSTFACLGE